MSDSVRPQRWQPTRLPRSLGSPGKNTGVGCHFLLQCLKVQSESESLSHVRLLATPWTAAYQAPPSMGFSRQEYWSGVPLLSLAFHWTEVFNYDVIKVIIIFVLCCVLVKFCLQCLFLPCDYENIFLCFLLFTLLFYVSHLHLYRICSLALK